MTNQLLTFARGGKPTIRVIEIDEHLENKVAFHLSGSNAKPRFDIAEALWDGWKNRLTSTNSDTK